MKRLLSSLMIALATMVVLPAHADNPCRNLVNVPDKAEAAYGYSSDSTQLLNAIKNLTVGQTYTISANYKARYSGGAREIRLRIGDTVISPYLLKANQDGSRQSQTFVMTQDMANATRAVVYFGNTGTEWNAQGYLKNIQIEQGSTATEYVPYNPLCETCDGMVTNYESATGTVVQNGTPTPTNPIEPVFYKQGDMVLRKVGDVADSYDSTTGKITRRVGVKVLDGTETYSIFSQSGKNSVFLVGVANSGGPGNSKAASVISNKFSSQSRTTTIMEDLSMFLRGDDKLNFFIRYDLYDNNLSGFKSWLAQQYAAGTPVTVYYPLAEAVEETVGTSYCVADIKIATTKYTEDAFAGLMTTLSEAITKVTNIVDTTVQQATEIGNLATTKQDRPDTDCPAGRKCLLIMGADNKPHWYLIQE